MDTKCGMDEQSWLVIEEQASPFTGKKTNKASVVKGRRWSSLANAVMVALIMTMPPILLMLGGHLSTPAVWIKSTVSELGTRRGNCNLCSY